MSDQIRCPQCQALIPLSEAISTQLRDAARQEWEKENAGRLAAEKDKAVKDARTAVELRLSTEMKDLQRQVEEKNKRLGEAQAAELDLRRQQRELEDRQKSFELDVQRKMDSERRRIGEEAARKAADEHRTKELEKEKQISDLLHQIEDLKRVAQQGSQQTQGEVIELEFESILRNRFPYDRIEPVSKGIRGADLVQDVHTKSGQRCGAIIWEIKNTKTWTDTWIEKLKDDQRAIKADLAVLLTTTLPKDLLGCGFGGVQGIWVTNQAAALALAGTLRMTLIQVAAARNAAEGRQEKMEAVYNYLAGVEFRQRIEGIMETFVGMREQLEQEKRALTKLWATREKQIERMTQGMSGLHGDLKGIIGASLPAIKALELDALPEPQQQATFFP